MLQSLERRSGLPIALDLTTNAIALTEGVRVQKVSERTAWEMAEFTSEPQADAGAEVIYSMYRNVERLADAAAIASSNLRYDITVIPPGVFAGPERREFFRTAGHYHPAKPGTSVGYPEIYEVLSGWAYWLLERPSIEDASRLEEIFCVEAGPGEKVVMLPGFGHMTVNAFHEPLVVANIIRDTFAYDYTPYRVLRGSGYWVVEGPTPKRVEFLLNPNYALVPPLRKLLPREVPELGLMKETPAYFLFRDPAKLDFLSNPERYLDLLTPEKCFRSV